MRKQIQRWIFIGMLALILVAAIGAALGEWLPGRGNGVGADPMEIAVDTPRALPDLTPVPMPVPTPVPVPAPTPEPTAQSGRKLDPEGKMIALTFDDGPGKGTLRILQALEKVDGRATFFMVGNRVQDHAEAARKVAAQGSELGTHTRDHKNLTKLTVDQMRWEIKSGLDVIEKETGVRPRVLRPPYGSVNDQVKKVCAEMGITIANWNIDPEDWKVRNAKTVYKHIMKKAKDGGIIVCHDLYPETALAMEHAIVDLAAQGYQLVTVSELLQARAGGGEAGRLYYGA